MVGRVDGGRLDLEISEMAMLDEIEAIRPMCRNITVDCPGDLSSSLYSGYKAAMLLVTFLHVDRIARHPNT